jgi:hypothetical protein
LLGSTIVENGCKAVIKSISWKDVARGL